MSAHPLCDTRLDEYWDWVSVALFLLIPVDMLTSLFAAHAYGTAIEVNPLMRWALEAGLIPLVALNLLATVLAASLFYVLFRTVENTTNPTRRVFLFGFEVWLGLVISAGFLVFANNISVIILGQSLL
jgi:hypothetical protein